MTTLNTPAHLSPSVNFGLRLTGPAVVEQGIYVAVFRVDPKRPAAYRWSVWRVTDDQGEQIASGGAYSELWARGQASDEVRRRIDEDRIEWDRKNTMDQFE